MSGPNRGVGVAKITRWSVMMEHVFTTVATVPTVVVAHAHPHTRIPAHTPHANSPSFI